MEWLDNISSEKHLYIVWFHFIWLYIVGMSVIIYDIVKRNIRNKKYKKIMSDRKSREID